jgi:hypothetical protein
MNACPFLAVTALAMAAVAAPCAHAQIYKCVDKAGRTTYQQAPCADVQKGGPLTITIDNGGARPNDDATDWAAMAREKKVVVGMPRGFVAQAWGTPAEMRSARIGEAPGDVWVYRRNGADARVGLRGGVVAWLNEATDPVVASPAAGASFRQSLAAGAACGTLEQELGKPDVVEDDVDPALGRMVTRMMWKETDPQRERLTVFCDGGVALRVDRKEFR